MGLKSVKVPQPEFSDWVIKRRQELNLSPACLREKLDNSLSERTLKYLEDGRKDAFSEYTLIVLAQGLDLDYPDLLKKVDELKSSVSQNTLRRGRVPKNRSGQIFLSVLLVTLLFFSLLSIKELKDFQAKVTAILPSKSKQLQAVVIHPDHPQVIITYDERGNILWQKTLDTKVRKVDLLDLDQDGQKEVVAGTWKNNSSSWGDRPGWLFVWNAAGDLITECNLWKPSIYPAQEPHTNIRDFQLTDLEKDGKLDLVVAVRGVEYYPSRLAILHFQDSQFTEVSTYWNPGYVGPLFIEDIDGDGFPEIICGAVNNDLKRVSTFGVAENVFAMFMLQARSVFGQAPPYLGKAPKGSQVWYHYITPPSSNEGSNVVGIRAMGENEKVIHFKLRDGCFFYLDYSGKIIDRFYGDDCTGETELHFVSNEKKDWDLTTR